MGVKETPVSNIATLEGSTKAIAEGSTIATAVSWAYSPSVTPPGCQIVRFSEIILSSANLYGLTS